ncbi:MAG: hypothetical protein QM760_13160 [Nibricoccus sp.]
MKTRVVRILILKCAVADLAGDGEVECGNSECRPSRAFISVWGSARTVFFAVMRGSIFVPDKVPLHLDTSLLSAT